MIRSIIRRCRSMDDETVKKIKKSLKREFGEQGKDWTTGGYHNPIECKENSNYIFHISVGEEVVESMIEADFYSKGFRSEKDLKLEITEEGKIVNKEPL